jgi:hypothetical protein
VQALIKSFAPVLQNRLILRLGCDKIKERKEKKERAVVKGLKTVYICTECEY